MTEKTKYLYENKDIGDVLAQGFAKICQQKPKFPISYLARFLKNYTINNQQKTNLIDRLEHNKVINQKLAKQYKQQQTKQLAKASALQKTQQQKTKFLSMISAQQQPETVLNKFCQWVCERLGFGAVYVGELEYQEKKIDLMNQDSEEGHLEMEKDKIVKFKYSSTKQANVIVGKQLTLQSVVGKLLTQVPEAQGQQQPPQQQQQPLESTPLQPQPPSTYLPSVVDNQQLKFFTYPKLGAYFATTMTIKSYLHQKLIDENLSKVETFRKLLGEYEKEMEEREGKFRQMYEEKVGSGVDEKELEVLEEEFEKEKEGFVKPVQEAFVYIERKFIICADTLGQDRQIGEQQRKQFLTYITHLKTSWQNRQHQQLMSDIQRQLSLSTNPHGQQSHQPQSSNPQQQLTLLFQQQQKQLHSHEEVEKVKDNQKLMELELNTLRIEKTKQYLLEEKFARYWEHLMMLNVVKYHQVVKQFLIVLGFKKEQFCFAGTNVLDWRKTKTLFNSLKETINEKLRVLTPRGSKPEEIMNYAKCSRITKNLQNLQVLTLANYNVYLALILRLLQLYVKTRLLDKEVRVQKITVQRQVRQQKVKQAEDKANEKKEKLDALKVELEQKGELQTFDEQAWSTQYDEENPLIQIPDQVQDEFDLDLGEGQEKNEAT